MGCHFSRENFCYSLSCCFCVKHRAACYWIGGVGIVWGGFATVVDFITAYLPYQYCQRCLQYKLNAELSYAGGYINAVQWLLCVLLIHGARKELRWLLVPWLSWTVVNLTMQLLWVFITLPYTPTIRGFASLFQFIWGVHYFIVVKTHYTRLALTFTPPEEPLRPVPPNSPTRKHKRRKRRVNPALQPSIRTLVGAAVKLQYEMTRIRWHDDDPEIIVVPKRWSNEVDRRSLAGRPGLGEEGVGESAGGGSGGTAEGGGRGGSAEGGGGSGEAAEGEGDGAVGEGREHSEDPACRVMLETDDKAARETEKANVSRKKKRKKSRERKRRAGNPEAEEERSRRKKERKQAKQKREIRRSEGGKSEADRGEREEANLEQQGRKDTPATARRRHVESGVAASVGGDALVILEEDDHSVQSPGRLIDHVRQRGERASPARGEAAGVCMEGHFVALGDTQVKWMLHDFQDQVQHSLSLEAQVQHSPSLSSSLAQQLLPPGGSSSAELPAESLLSLPKDPLPSPSTGFPKKPSPSRSLPTNPSPTQSIEFTGMALHGHSSLLALEGKERMENLDHFEEEALGSLRCVAVEAESDGPLDHRGGSPARNYTRRISYKIAIECDNLYSGYDPSDV